MDVVSNIVSSVLSLFGSGNTSQTSDYYKIQSSQYNGIDYSSKIDTNNKSIKYLTFAFIGSIVFLIYSLTRNTSK